MLLKYRNRRNEDHYIKEVLTKKGAKRYYIVKNIEEIATDSLLKEMPEGYEFYEFPEDGRVVFRKIVKSNFTASEKEILSGIMDKHTSVEDYIIDLGRDAMLIYIGYFKNADREWIGEKNFDKIQVFDPKLRFEKSEEEKTYKVQRFCDLSSYFGWITLETSENLEYLGNKYCYHIDKESLLEFWIEGEEDW